MYKDKKPFRIVSAMILSAVAFQFTSIADTPREQVLKPYQAYKSALARKNYKQAIKQAHNAWKKSETHYGDSKTTSDLAYNYASIASIQTKLKDRKEINAAFERSIELCETLDTERVSTSLKRRAKYAGYLARDQKQRNLKQIIEDAKQYATKNNAIKTNNYAQFLVDISQIHLDREQFIKAADYAGESTEILENINGLKSETALHALYIIGHSKAAKDQWLAGAQDLEQVFMNSDNILDPNHALLRKAYVIHDLAERNYHEKYDPEYERVGSFGFCRECWPNSKIDRWVNRPNLHKVEIERTPPKMPNPYINSGYVALIFDVGADGYPVNLRAGGSSEPETFDTEAITALQQWKYDLDGHTIPQNELEDLTTVITFQLTTYDGKLLDYSGDLVEY